MVNYDNLDTLLINDNKLMKMVSIIICFQIFNIFINNKYNTLLLIGIYLLNDPIIMITMVNILPIYIIISHGIKINTIKAAIKSIFGRILNITRLFTLRIIIFLLIELEIKNHFPVIGLIFSLYFIVLIILQSYIIEKLTDNLTLNTY